MPSLPFGVYVVGDSVVRMGREDRPARPGESFHAITNQAIRDLIEANELADLKFVGGAVVNRPQPEIDARILAETIAEDEAYFDEERMEAYTQMILGEINALRPPGLPPRTLAELRAAYKVNLGR